jgi:tetratricopeptide (TPR) repeat protein
MNARVRWSALVLAGGLAAGCATPAGPRLDDQIQRDTAAGRAAYDTGSIGKAADLYGLALARARLTDDAVETARAAYNLAACLAALGRYTEAHDLLVLARAGFGTNGSAAAQTYLVEARMLRRQGQGEEAAKVARTALGASDDPDASAQAGILIADMACDAADGAKAQGALEWVRGRLKSVKNPRVQADAASVSARIALLGKAFGEAGRGWDACAGWLRRAGQYRQMAEALNNAGEAYQQAGLWREAFDRYVRAGQSYLGGGDRKAALAALQRGMALGPKLNDEAASARGGALLQELQRGGQ